MYKVVTIVLACLLCVNAWDSSDVGRRWNRRGNVMRMSANDHINGVLSRLGFYNRGGGNSDSRSIERNDGRWFWAYMNGQYPFVVNTAPPDIPTLANRLGLTDLVAAVKKAGLAGTLSEAGPFTVFGPDNKAFKTLPTWAKQAVKNVTFLGDLLKYHVLPAKVLSSDLTNELTAPTAEGRPVRINLYKNNTIATAQCAPIDLKRVDKMASNGVIHVMKKVMFPPSGNIVAALSACPVYKTLVKAVGIAGLVDTLSGPGPFTVFAPSDKAFAKIPPDVLNKLINDPAKLKKVLTYHVVSGTFCKVGIQSGSVTTVNGSPVAVKVSGDLITVNDASVIVADAPVTNGVVHAIDSVLLPPDIIL